MVFRRMMRLWQGRASRPPSLPASPVPPPHPKAKGAWAGWVGRNLAHLHYAVAIEPTWLEVNRLAVPVPDLPPAFHGFRVAQLSDFHGSRKITTDYLREAVALTHAEKPDLVVLTGDFIHKGDRHIERVADALAELRAPHGAFAVLGNHDYSVRNAMGIRRYPDLHRKVGDALAERGIQVLRNVSVPLERDGSRIFLTGLEDLWSRACDLEAGMQGLDAATPRIVLAHNPMTIERLSGHRCDLMLSGHTHGGQVLLPKLGRVALGPHGRRFAAGLYQVGGSWLYVNKGVGFGFRIRYGVRPEVAIVTLAPPARPG